MKLDDGTSVIEIEVGEHDVLIFETDANFGIEFADKLRAQWEAALEHGKPIVLCGITAKVLRGVR